LEKVLTDFDGSAQGVRDQILVDPDFWWIVTLPLGDSSCIKGFFIRQVATSFLAKV